MAKVILGGGLSGLSAAYYLTKQVPAHTITILESSSKTGGWIKSRSQKNGIIFEQGPRTIRPKGPSGQNTLQLVEELNLSNQVVPIRSSHPAAKNRMIYAKNSLHKVPFSFLQLFTRETLLSKPLISYLLQDIKAKRKIVFDESIYDFTSRRFGSEFADYLISPMICGICAGNAKEISVNFLMEKLFMYEQEFGSISRGLLHNLLAPEANLNVYNNALNERAKKERWSIYSFKNGCETLPNTLETYIKDKGAAINFNTYCKELIFEGENRLRLVLNNDEHKIVDHVISSIPAKSLAPLIKKQHPYLADLLENINCVSVGVVNLYFDKKLITDEGFGLLVAPKEKLPILGIIFDSCCFPKDSSSTVLTAMMGGYWFKEHFGENPTDDILLETALSQLKYILKINEKPVYYKVNILKQCIPQYVIGHHMNMWKIENYIKEHKLPISLCGSSYNGIGINDVILSGKNAANKAI